MPKAHREHADLTNLEAVNSRSDDSSAVVEALLSCQEKVEILMAQLSAVEGQAFERSGPIPWVPPVPRGAETEHSVTRHEARIELSSNAPNLSQEHSGGDLRDVMRAIQNRVQQLERDNQQLRRENSMLLRQLRSAQESSESSTAMIKLAFDSLESATETFVKARTVLQSQRTRGAY